MRPDWHTYFMTLAVHASTRATCPRASVGCIITRDRDILATGYNGSISGMLHCTQAECDIVDNHCIRTIHAERNAICMAARKGISLQSSQVYITHFPCWECLKILAQVGVTNIYYLNDYNPDQRVLRACHHKDIVITQIGL